MALRILVVDDAGFVRDTIKRALRQMLPRCEIKEAVDGRKAMSQLRSAKFDIILSDWEMPEMSGDELLTWVREQPELQKTPFIMITSRGDRDNVIAAVKGGVNDYITKPFTPDELQRKVAKQLRRLGYKGTHTSAQNAGQDSASLLTGGAKKVHVQKPRVIKDAVDFGKPTAAPVASATTAGQFKGRAFLRFAGVTAPCECAVKDLSLQALSGAIMRPEHNLTLFDQAAVDLENERGEAVARLNGYIHTLQSLQPVPTATGIKIIVRFVDDDPAKLEALSLILSGK